MKEQHDCQLNVVYAAVRAGIRRIVTAFSITAMGPAYRRDLLFSYVDSRDGASAVALAPAHAVPGFEIYDVAASGTGSAIPTAELAALHFLGVPVRQGLGEFETLMSIDKARSRLGFEPEHLWRDG